MVFFFVQSKSIKASQHAAICVSSFSFPFDNAKYYFELPYKYLTVRVLIEIRANYVEKQKRKIGGKPLLWPTAHSACDADKCVGPCSRFGCVFCGSGSAIGPWVFPQSNVFCYLIAVNIIGGRLNINIICSFDGWHAHVSVCAYVCKCLCACRLFLPNLIADTYTYNTLRIDILLFATNLCMTPT